jgi:endonuclease/exonuclease/phosphatase family metal-dependent hydrolase
MLHRVAAILLALVAFAGRPSLALLPGDPFVVASYNVANWLTMDRFVDGQRIEGQPKPDRDKQAAIDVIAIHKPDILGIVEIGSEKDLADLQGRLKTAGLDYPHAEWASGPDPDRHVALLSKFPIVERNSLRNVAFDLDGKPQAVQRGILDVTLEPTDDYRIRVLGVHFKSKRPDPGFDQAALRGKEAEALRAHVDAILETDPDTNILLFGDFNDTKNEYPIRHLLGGPPARRLKDLLLDDELGDRWTHYWKAADIYSRIDYLIVSPGLFKEVDREKRGIDRSENWFVASDHRLIFATIKAADE